MVLTKLSTRFALVAVLVFVLAFSTFGMSAMDMNMGMNNGMHGAIKTGETPETGQAGHTGMPCPFLGNALCAMSPQEHVVAAASMLTMIVPLLNATIQVLLLIFSIASTFLLFGRAYAPPQNAVSYAILSRRRYPLRNALQEAFSNGILNPKAF